MMFAETELLLKIIQQSNYIIPKSISENVLKYYKSLLSIPETTNIINLYAIQSITL